MSNPPERAASGDREPEHVPASETGEGSSPRTPRRRGRAAVS
ncbi:hypothetical protein [Luteimicrobium album]|nr:hypothetical protein [Luteimicrobium album]